MPLAMRAPRSLMPCSVDAAGSELSANDILQSAVHQDKVRVYAFETDVLILQFTQLRQVRHRHARILIFPLVVGRLAHAMLSARLADLRAQFDLLEDGNDLAFTESGFLHVETPLVGILCSQLAQIYQGASEWLSQYCWSDLEEVQLYATQ